MRRPLLVLACAALAIPSVVPSSVAATADQGRYLTPFREDGARYVAATNTFIGGRHAGRATDANGCITSPSNQTGAPAGNPRAYDCVPAGASMVYLPGGKVLFWNALEGEEQLTGATNSGLMDGAEFLVNDESRVLDPLAHSFAKPSPVGGGATNTSHPNDLPLGPLSAQHYSYDTASMFCSDQVFLRDGSVLVVGGTDYYTEPYVPVVDKGVIELEGVRNSRYFDRRDNTWRQGPFMSHGRWYPSLVTLGNGNVFVASGVTKLIKPGYPTALTESGTNVRQTETLLANAARPKWVGNGESGERSLPLFPRLHLLPDGHVYYDAAGQAFNPAGESYDEALWYQAASYDPATRSWTDLGLPGADPEYLAANPAAAPFVGFRGSTFSAALTMRPSFVRGGVPTYTSASFLTAGGVLLPTPGSYFPVANSRINTVTTGGGTETLSTVGTGDLNTARWYGTATPLPNGQVFVSSGANADEVDLPGSESPIRTNELFTPTVDAAGRYTGGSWAPAGSQSRKRTYHNNAVLMADGSVLIGGHAPIVTGYYQTTDTPDLPGRDGTNNHHDGSFQVWQPPYFNDARRPTITGAVQSGRTLVVGTPQAASIASVVLMRNTAQTHLIDGDARTVSLPVLSRGNGYVTVGLPSTTNVLPHGPYLLFANRSTTSDLSGRNAAGLLPSKGVQVFVQGTSVPSVVTPAWAAARGKALGKAKGAPHGKANGRGDDLAGTAAAAAPVRSTSEALVAPTLVATVDRRRTELDLGLVLLGTGTALWLRRRRTRRS
jgi:hypothetical protein